MGSFVVLTRLTPLPCFINNYAIALFTSIPASVYIPATLVDLLPITAANVYAGAVAPPFAGLTAVYHGGASAAGPAAIRAATAAGRVGVSGLVGLLASWYLHAASAGD